MPYTFPRTHTRTRWVDYGSIEPSTAGQVCPNCRSLRYRQTTSTESCPDCGLECDYWGAGANEVYQAMLDASAVEEQEKEFRIKHEQQEPYY